MKCVKMHREKRPSRRVGLRAGLLGAFVVASGLALWYWREPLRMLFRDPSRVREWIAGFGFWAPLVSIALSTAQVLLAPVPGQIIGVANGYLYGVWLGTLYSLLGLLIGTALAMWLARQFGRPLVERLVKREHLERWDRITMRQGPWFFFLIFLIPGLPDDLVCFLIGLSPLPLPHMVLLALLGRLPGVLVSCWVGAYATGLPLWAWIPLGVGTAGIAWIFWRYRDMTETRLLRFIRYVVRRKVVAEEVAKDAACGTQEEGR